MENFYRAMGEFSCWVGWHNWLWRLVPGSELTLNDPPPRHAKCSRCGVKYNNKV